MSRISKAFEQKGKIAYLTAGDGDSVAYFLALVKGGANILEIGIPFSDPIADGPTIQRAMERSLKAGTNLASVLEIVRKIRAKSDVALVLFTYFNPIVKNLKQFLKDAKEAGADGILVVDLPHEESKMFRQECRKVELFPIPVAAPSTPLERIGSLTEEGGFLYYACRKGTTGAKETLPEDFGSKITAVRNHSRIPVAVGFGIATREAVQIVLEQSDGCVVGSHFVWAVERGCPPEELEKGILC